MRGVKKKKKKMKEGLGKRKGGLRQCVLDLTGHKVHLLL